MGVSAVLIVQDEERQLGDCLATLAWADEIVVVDGGSRDGTVALARGLGARVVERAFTDFADQRNFALGHATQDWVFMVDADERVTPALRDEIARAVRDPAFAAYRVPHLDYMFGRWIRHGGWYPQYHLRLARRDRSRWDRPVHEVLAVDGAVGDLRQPLLHFSHGDVRDFVRKLNRYTDREAELEWAGRAPAVWRVVLEPPLYFLYKFVWQRGFLDGAHGFVLAQLLAFYRFTRLAKAWTRARAPQDPAAPPDMGGR
jgi:glycosyltransferase involved in cell wall biosynthesis